MRGENWFFSRSFADVLDDTDLFIIECYVNDICGLVTSEDGMLIHEYRTLLRFLWETPYRYSHFSNENRLEDGLGLRNRDHTAEYLLDGIVGYPCSLLEVLVALFVRYSEETVYPGDTSIAPWLFYQFLVDHGLDFHDDLKFDLDVVNGKIDAILDEKTMLFELNKMDVAKKLQKNWWYLTGKVVMREMDLQKKWPFL